MNDNLKKFNKNDEVQLYDGTKVKFSKYDESEKGKCYVYKMFCGNYEAYESKIEVCRICEERYYFDSLGRWGTTWIKNANDKVYWES